MYCREFDNTCTVRYLTCNWINNCFECVRLTKHGSYYRTKALCVLGTLHAFSSIKMSKRKQTAFQEFGFTKRVCIFYLLFFYLENLASDCSYIFLFFERFESQCSLLKNKSVNLLWKGFTLKHSIGDRGSCWWAPDPRVNIPELISGWAYIRGALT